jgi:hypothetical protein
MRNIDSRHGYARLSWSGLRLSSSGRPDTATAEFWRRDPTTVALRFTAFWCNLKFTYCYYCSLPSGLPVTDEAMSADNVLGELDKILSLWLAEGCDNHPLYYFE